MTAGELHHQLARLLARQPGAAELPVVLSHDSEGNEARTLDSVEVGGWYQPLEEQPHIGDLPCLDDADPGRDTRCLILWPTV
jgi:hypothetical protein